MILKALSIYMIYHHHNIDIHINIAQHNRSGSAAHTFSARSMYSGIHLGGRPLWNALHK
jgi:hypothetical protein